VQNLEAHLTFEHTSYQFRRRTYLYLGFLLAAIMAFHVATLRDGHLWGDDFAMYILHAQNIAEGRPYADTGYVYNPAVPVYGPRMYPPVFPLLLAPLYKVFGLSLFPMKVEQVFFIVLMLATVFVMWHHELGTGYSLALVAILGFSLNFWTVKDSILSDLPFLFFFYVAVLLLRWKPQSQKQRWAWSVFLGLTLYLAIGTRTAGLTLVPGVLLYQWLRTRRINRFTWIALVLCAAALIAQNWVVGTVPGGYLEQLHSTTPKTILFNVLRYSRALAGSWVGWVRNPFSYFLLAVIGVLTLVGFRSQRRNGVAAIECLLVPYLILMVLWPFGAGIRYALPFVPWITFLALSGLHELSSRFKLRYPAAAPCGFLLLLAIPASQAYHASDFGTIRENTGLPEFNDLCKTVRNTTGPEDIFIYYRARALTLYTNRRASTYNLHGTQAELWEYSRKIHATYLITTNAFHEDSGFLARYVDAHPEEMKLTYRNAHFRLYRMHHTVDPTTASISR
jgi:hypothetical protein